MVKRILFLSALLAPLMFSQSAELSGVVTDRPTGSAVADASIEVRNQATGIRQHTATNSDGSYFLTGLKPGTYLATVQAKGFKTLTRDGIVLEDQQRVRVDLSLEVGEVQQAVTVTAEKRTERIQDTPVSVVVLDGDTLSTNRQVLLRDYADTVPGFSLSPQIEENQFLAIRGISTGSYTPPTVGIMVDDVPYGGTTGTGDGARVPNIDPGDIERIEILKGPQGTLYGADSMGGLVKYVTKDPSTDGYSGQIEVGTSSVHNGAEPGYDLHAAVNIPVNNTLAFRVSAFRRHDAGYIDNPGNCNGTRCAPVHGINEAEADGARLAVMWKPSQSFTMKLSALYQDIQGKGISEVEKGPGLGDLQQNYDAGVGPYDISYQAYSANLNYKLGKVDLTSITGYNVNNYVVTLDFSFLAGAEQQQFGVPGAPWHVDDRLKKVTQEVRLSAPIGETFELLAGGFFTHEHDAPSDVLSASDAATGRPVATWYTYHQNAIYRETAGFLNLTYHITDRFDIQAGVRDSQYRLEIPANDLTGLPPFVTGGITHVPGAASSGNAVTYLFTPRYKLSSDTMVYARFASGYRPGGPNLNLSSGQVPPYKADQNYDYELGVKTNLFDKLLYLEASLYYIDWKNIQVSIFTPQNVTFQSNGGSAKSEGAELSATLRPLKGLTIVASGSYDDAVLTQAFPGCPTSCPTYGLRGYRLPDVSKFMGHLSVRQEFPLPIESHSIGYVGGEVSYVGDKEGIFTTSALRQFMPAYTKVDLRAGVRFGVWDAHVYANNAGDVRALIGGGAGYFNSQAYVYIQPRTVGVSLTRYF